MRGDRVPGVAEEQLVRLVKTGEGRKACLEPVLQANHLSFSLDNSFSPVSHEDGECEMTCVSHRVMREKGVQEKAVIFSSL